MANHGSNYSSSQREFGCVFGSMVVPLMNVNVWFCLLVAVVQRQFQHK